VINDLNRRLKSKQLTISLTDEAKNYVIDTAYDPVYGARPLKRFIQSNIETLVAREIIGGSLNPDDNLTVILDDGKLAVRVG